MEEDEEETGSLDLSRELLLTFNGPILRRPGGEGRLSKLIAVCHVAVKSVATCLDVSARRRGILD